MLNLILYLVPMLKEHLHIEHVFIIYLFCCHITKWAIGNKEKTTNMEMHNITYYKTQNRY